MSILTKRPSGHLPWYAWPLVPLVLPAVLIVMLPLGILALLSMPYFLVFPDRHAHIYDFKATSRQRELLSRWRSGYRRLGVGGRLARSLKLWRRRRTHGK